MVRVKIRGQFQWGQFFYMDSFTWTLEVKLRSPGLHRRCLLTEPSCQPCVKSSVMRKKQTSWQDGSVDKVPAASPADLSLIPVPTW